MSLRELSSADEAAFEEFVGAHRDSSMFLLSNARKYGLDAGGRVGAFRGDRLVGVVEHGAMGVVLVQALESIAELTRACVAMSRRPVVGLSGPREQVHLARAALGLATADTLVDAHEGLYGLDLADLVVPAPLANGVIGCRPPYSTERDLLVEWRLAYDVEVLGASDSPEQRARAAAFLDAQIAEGNAWVADVEGAPVSLSALNAALPDIVQLGGIYTPPPLRGQGFAKVAVAGGLVTARKRGATRAVLFTNSSSAVRSYEALGFRRVGDYSLVLFRESS